MLLKMVIIIYVNRLSTNPTKWSNTQTTRWLLPTNCLSVLDHFVRLALEGLNRKAPMFEVNDKIIYVS